MLVQLGLRFHKWPYEAEQLLVPEVAEIIATLHGDEEPGETPRKSWKA